MKVTLPDGIPEAIRTQALAQFDAIERAAWEIEGALSALIDLDLDLDAVQTPAYFDELLNVTGSFVKGCS